VSTDLSMSPIIIRSSKGPSTEPSGTPDINFLTLELAPPTTTLRPSFPRMPSAFSFFKIWQNRGTPRLRPRLFLDILVFYQSVTAVDLVLIIQF